MNQDRTIVFDTELIFKLTELIEDGWKKLKLFVLSKSKEKNVDSNLDFFNYLKKSFKEISFKLKELKLCEELRYFLSISNFVEYIVYQNSLDNTFGHCQFALDVLKFFLELFKTNLDFYAHPNKYPDDEFDLIQNEIKAKHHEYRREFYWSINEPAVGYDEEKMYAYAKSLRG